MGQDSSRGCRPFHVYQWEISVLSSSLLLSLFKKAFLLRAYHPHRGSLNKQKSSLFSCNLTVTLKFLLDHDPMILVFRRDLVIMKVYMHARTPFTITSESNVGSSDNQIHNIYPPANEVCEGYVFTRVCLSTGGCLGRYPPWEGTPPWAGTPPGQVQPPGQVTPGQVHPPWAGTQPQEQCMLGDMGNKRAVRILLECILVLSYNFHINSQWYRFEQQISRIRL